MTRNVEPADQAKQTRHRTGIKIVPLPLNPVRILPEGRSHQSAFAVRYAPGSNAEVPGHWQLAMPGEDSTTSDVTSVDNAAALDSVSDWTHLALVYDGFSKEVRLYVNGVLDEVLCADEDGNGDADDASCTDRIPWAENVLPFKATGSLQVGRLTTAGTGSEHWPGLADDVWIFQGALSDEQVSYLAGQFYGTPTEIPDPN
ncbi:LamG-like jellyroll fold domain-containing protein [Streptomyces sp. SS8]